MATKNKLTKFEQAVHNRLSGEKLSSFQDFYAFLKSERLLKGIIVKSNSSKIINEVIRYQGRQICRLYIIKDSWSLRFVKEHVNINQCEGLVSDGLKAFILENIVTELSCKVCHCSSSMTILGKSFNAVCTCHMLRIENPDGKALEYVKELILLHKKIIDEIVADFLTVTGDKKIHLSHHSISPDTRTTEEKYLKEEYRNYFYKTLGDDCEKYPLVKNIFNDMEQFTGYTLKYLAECCQNGFEPKPNIALHYVQNKLKPNIEDVITQALEFGTLKGEYWDNALNFIAWLRENKMKSRIAGYACTAAYKGTVLYNLRLGLDNIDSDNFSVYYSNKWKFSPCLNNIDDYQNKIFAEGLQDFVWDNVNACNSCAHKCGEKSSKKKMILGKEFTGFGCSNDYGANGCRLWVSRADESAIDSLKKLILWEREARNNK